MEKEFKIFNQRCVALDDAERFPLSQNVKMIVAAFNESIADLSSGDAAIAEELFLKRASPVSIMPANKHNYDEQFAVAFYLGTRCYHEYDKTYFLHMQNYVAYWIENERTVVEVPAKLAAAFFGLKI